MNAPAIATRGLTKRFPGGQIAVDGVDLAVPGGSVYGFLGPNGSGKTTTIRMLLGLITPTGGTSALFGAPARAALTRVGALVEGPAFYPWLTGTANLLRLDAANPAADASSAKRRVADSLDRVGLTAAAAKRYKAYSLGMRQRLAIASTLLSRRDLLILDEPTNGLDPQGTREVRGLIKDIAADGTTVFVSSHLLAEVEQMCTHIGVMRTGRLVAQGSMSELRSASSTRVEVETVDVTAATKVLTDLALGDVKSAPDHVSAEIGRMAPEHVSDLLFKAGVSIRGFQVIRPSLEDVFVGLTGEGFDVDR
ncbi:ABC transporter ATP-binding protein [Herbidospora mongoliensis]|uniref:ABC transporter ATP-binding protein n=1 Tax=Herbidospora mongoliensis TaxID=688067 RepID=UPI000834C82C|nr:ABC transporter ATP-binding protein [Herbidospora mongoliensis]